ncbi:CbtA family protein [Nitratireductor luteus]|uniref:CbtA family protein n=1 Tax=Nitratireductor luteus TaxID=2976980 RepID=UPI0022404747|nr:CbtA family protein [Nitratireductor luteus]
MNIFRNVVFAAALAGLCAGIVMAVLQTAFTVPLILQAETFEEAAPEHSHEATDGVAGGAEAAVQAHTHDEDAWAPADGFERAAYTALANIVTGVGFALLVLVASEFAGGLANWRQGLFWGLAGFAVFTLAPGLGLPPELPAMPAADLLSRQVWWIATVALTAAGLALIAFRASPLMALIGVALIVAPHVVGAPQPASYETPVPAELHHRFVVAATVTNLVFWLVLGAVAGFVRTRFSARLGAPRAGLV